MKMKTKHFLPSLRFDFMFINIPCEKRCIADFLSNESLVLPIA